MTGRLPAIARLFLPSQQATDIIMKRNRKLFLAFFAICFWAVGTSSATASVLTFQEQLAQQNALLRAQYGENQPSEISYIDGILDW
jgi:hypothetical protein